MNISQFHFQFFGKFSTLNVSVKYSEMKPPLENELRKHIHSLYIQIKIGQGSFILEVLFYMFFLKNRRTEIIFIPIDLFSLKSFSCVECESKTLIPFLRVRSIMLRLQNDKYPIWLWSYFIYKSILLFWKAITCLILEI